MDKANQSVTGMRAKIARWEIKQERFPWILLAVCLLAYGTLIWDLGFYWDDWEILYLSKAAETPGDIFLFPFRPLRVLLDIWLVDLLGYRPIYWHVLMLAIRYIGGLVLWQLLREIWSNHTQRNAWIVLIFVVYPSFLHHAMAVIYVQMFISVLLYLVSLLLMVRAYKLKLVARTAGQFWLLLILSLITGIMNLFVTEYMAAMELWRPAVLLILVMESNPLWKDRVKSVFSMWLPYLVYLFGYVIWRLTYVKTVIDDPNKAVLLDEIATSPVSGFLSLFQSALQDSIFVLVTSWGNIITPESINFLPSSLLIYGLMVFCGLVLAFLIPRMVDHAGSDQDQTGNWQAVLLGIYGLILGLTPAWVIGRDVFTGRFNTRFSIPVLVGASLLIVAVLFYLIPQKKRNVIVFSLLVALAVGKQVEMTNNFRWDWVRQERVYWQIHWRAPEISSNTALLTNKAVSGFTTTYPVAYAVNLLYSDETPAMTPEYWWFEIYKDNLAMRAEGLSEGKTISSNFHNVTFSTESQNSLLFDLPVDVSDNRCVWMLSPLDKNNPKISVEMASLAGLSNPDQIRTGVPNEQMVTVLGKEPDPSWCYFYQKAQLAHQFQDWDEVMSLYQQAVTRSLSPSNGYEYVPFITASVFLDDLPTASKLTKIASSISPAYDEFLCLVWEEIEREAPLSEGFDTTFLEVQEQLRCTK